MPTIAQLAQAIQHEEGFYPGSNSYTLNNPGDLRPPAGVTWSGQVGVTPAGFAVFSSYQAGLQALQTDITTHRQRNPNQTLQQFISTYAPLSDRNNPVQYAQNVADALGVSVDTPLKQLAGSAPAGIGQGSTSTVDLGIIPGPGAAPSTTSTPTVVSPAGLYTVTSAAPGALGGLGIIAAAVGLLLVLQD